MRAALAFSHSDGKSLFGIHDLNKISKGLHNEIPQSLIKQTLILSGQWDLFGSKLWIICKMSF